MNPAVAELLPYREEWECGGGDTPKTNLKKVWNLIPLLRDAPFSVVKAEIASNETTTETSNEMTDNTTDPTTVPAAAMETLREGANTWGTAQLIMQWGGQVELFDDGQSIGITPTTNSRSLFSVTTDGGRSLEFEGPTLHEVLPEADSVSLINLSVEAADTIDDLITADLTAAGYDVDPGSGDGALYYTVTPMGLAEIFAKVAKYERSQATNPER